MTDYLYLIHNDVENPEGEDDPAAWGRFFEVLRAGGHFRGGSALGGGCTRRGAATDKAFTHAIGGYMLIRAESLEQATALLDACPVVLRGGSVEVRELVKS
ncbi:MAG: YciI family protein [Planctomycetota bacterium]|nr:YciI family protein [Planctomycetota bacterium]